MFLPHAFHEKIISFRVESAHITHVFQGVVFVVLGLAIMIFSNRLEKKKN